MRHCRSRAVRTVVALKVRGVYSVNLLRGRRPARDGERGEQFRAGDRDVGGGEGAGRRPGHQRVERGRRERLDPGAVRAQPHHHRRVELHRAAHEHRQRVPLARVVDREPAHPAS